MESYNDLMKELELVSAPIKEKIQALIKKDAEEQIKNKKEQFELIKDKVFYGDKQTWNGFKDLVILVKPISCTDWGMYNCCKVVMFKMVFEKNELKVFCNQDSIRVDQFKTHYIPINKEILQNVNIQVKKYVEDFLSLFN